MHPSTTAIVVMERGSEWPLLGSSFANSIAISDDKQETTASLLSRLLRRLKIGGIPRERVSIAALACNGGAEVSQIARRVALARVLHRTLGSDAGKVVLSAPAVATPELRLQLLAVAEELMRDVRRARGAIEVRFGDPETEFNGAAPVSSIGQRQSFQIAS